MSFPAFEQLVQFDTKSSQFRHWLELLRNYPTVHREQITVLLASMAQATHPGTLVSHREQVLLLAFKKYFASHSVHLAVSLPVLSQRLQNETLPQLTQVLLLERKYPSAHAVQMGLSV